MYKRASLGYLIKVANNRAMDMRYKRWLIKRALDTNSSFSDDVSEVSNTISDTWQGVKDTTSAIVNAPRNAWDYTTNAVSDAWHNTTEAIVNAPRNAWNYTTNAISNAASSAANSLYTGTKKLLYTGFGGKNPDA